MARSPTGIDAMGKMQVDARRVDKRAGLVRRCARCGTPSVRVVETTFHFRGPVPVGRTYRQRCDGCGSRLTTESPLRATTELLTAGLLLAVGLAGVFVGPRTWWLMLVGPLGLALLARTAVRIVQTFRHPPVGA